MTWVNRQFYDQLTKSELALEWSVKEATELLKKVQACLPEAELYYWIEHNPKEQTNSCKNVCVGFNRNGIFFQISKVAYKNDKFYISCDISNFRYIDVYCKDRAYIGLVKPNYIGVFSRKKIEDWVDYQTTGYLKLAKFNAENELKIETFRKRLEEVPDVVWSNDKESGRIERGGLKYSFQITATRISEYIDLIVQVNTLDDFLAISDNKYISGPEKQ